MVFYSGALVRVKNAASCGIHSGQLGEVARVEGPNVLVSFPPASRLIQFATYELESGLQARLPLERVTA